MSHTTHARRRAARRFLPALVAAIGFVVPTIGGLTPWSPATTTAPASAEAVPAGSPAVSRYFGKGAYEGIRAAVAAMPRSCALSDDELTALVLAPIFKEVSMAETPDAAPSPMTLSRWDEWSGQASGSNNLNANYGLYPFYDPHGTPYKRAFWTPGVGIFQYDVAGVGAPYTAAEMMNVEFIARDVAAGMAQRYCDEGGSPAARRAAAWAPWAGLNGVAKSEMLFLEMVGPGQVPFARLGLVEGIDNTGGMQARTCVSGGEQVDCHYIDPGQAQGANWWAVDDPTGGAVASGEAPLTAPFYVIKRNGYEERHWLAEDTGYPVDISARRRLGQNARPIYGQPHSGLEWHEGSDLCDTARPEMGCTPEPAPAPEPAAPEPDAGGAAADEARPDGESAGADASLWAGFADHVQAATERGDAQERGDREPFVSSFPSAKGLTLAPPASR